jgi:hypothetical protein
VGREKEERGVFFNEWQWWVIYLNSKLEFGEVPPNVLHENHGARGLLMYSTKTMELGPAVDPRWS